MLVRNSYFLIIQGIILISFLLLGFLKKENKYFWFPSKFHFLIYLAGAIAIGYLFNKDYQLFCIPVKWTRIILFIYTIYLLGHLFLKKISFELINQFILGIGIFLSIYIICFGSFEYLFWILLQLVIIIPIFYLTKYLNKKLNTRIFDFMNFYGAAILLPYIILFWTLWQVKDKKRIHKISLAIIPLIFLISGIGMTIRMNQIIHKIDNSKDKAETAKSIIDNKVDHYLTELILGAHWKYHTCICLYDGKRPPFHDPVLGFANFITYFKGPYNYEIDLPDRIELYKQVFPNNKTKFDCNCAENEAPNPLF
jgi:hypothetical protein